MTKNILHIADNDLTHSMVHYLFSIHKLKEKNGYARVTDVAKELNLTKGSVSIALSGLKKKELVVEDENKFFSLSEKGHQQVHDILTSRTLLYYFLKDFIGVSEERSIKDACLMEHLMSDETREKFFIFMKSLTSDSKEEKNNFLKLKTNLDLSQFNTTNDFIKAQSDKSYILGEGIIN
ncbi:MAG: metal-dependent transcriptional regulator [Cyanobacteriota bacterium]